MNIFNTRTLRYLASYVVAKGLELLVYDPLHRFDWHWVPSIGHSGGIQLGCNKDVCDVLHLGCWCFPFIRYY